MDKVLFSSKSDDWSTPKEIYDFFKGLGFFDPCPLKSEIDGLSIFWGDRNFVNPPYSNIDGFVKKAIYEALECGCSSVLLVPARTDTRWFKDLYEFGCSFLFVNGRLKFGGSMNSAPFPSVFIFVNFDKFKDNSFCVVRRVDLLDRLRDMFL